MNYKELVKIIDGAAASEIASICRQLKEVHANSSQVAELLKKALGLGKGYKVTFNYQAPFNGDYDAQILIKVRNWNLSNYEGKTICIGGAGSKESHVSSDEEERILAVLKEYIRSRQEQRGNRDLNDLIAETQERLEQVLSSSGCECVLKEGRLGYQNAASQFIVIYRGRVHNDTTYVGSVQFHEYDGYIQAEVHSSGGWSLDSIDMTDSEAGIDEIVSQVQRFVL